MTKVESFVCHISIQLFLEGCAENPITYIDGESNTEVPYQQIVSLIELSEHCEQSFQYDCTLAPLEAEGIDYAFWMDRHGLNNTYFTGKFMDIFLLCDFEY